MSLLGIDRTGNNNHWTVNNMTVATDQMLDSPTNNFACMNPLSDSSATLSQGNLQNQYGGGNYYCPATFQLPKTGKWYWEVHITALHSNGNCYGRLGITYEDSNSKTINDGYGYGVYASGLHMLTSTGVYSTGLTDDVGDIIQFAVDMDNGKFYIGQDDTYYHTSGSYNDSNPSNGTNPAATSMDTTLDWRPDFNVGHDSSYGTKFHANFGQDSSFAGNKTAQGNQDSNSIGDFYYTPPTDFLALCTSNLPDPAVIPSEHFNTVTYSGTGATQSITGVGFQPDFTWLKHRNNPTAHQHNLFDVVRGATKTLHSNSTEAEETTANMLSSFDSDGFTVNTDNAVNQSPYNYVAWNWKANGAGVSNTNGTITSTVSANADAGFSIVSYTGTGVAATVGHGLSKAPELILTKNRSSAYNWGVYDSTNGATKYLYLNTTAAVGTYQHYWNNTEPTSSVFSVGTDVVGNGHTHAMVAYCFHSVEGYSKVGSHTGNGSTDGTFVYTGFRPALIIGKRVDSTEDWQIIDTARGVYNVTDYRLNPNNSNAEVAGSGGGDRLDILSNGFKARDGAGQWNASGSTYIYLAFAENPFKYTNAR